MLSNNLETREINLFYIIYKYFNLIKTSTAKWQACPLVLVTGPNMGGKSTLMRQTGLTVILAQIVKFIFMENYMNLLAVYMN